jgi:carbamate kinase
MIAVGSRVLVALGGNAMSAPDGSATEAHQIVALTAAAEHLADLAAAGFQVAVTHGNGPQVGNLLVKNELAAHVVPPVSLDWCVAQTQATIGFVLCNGLEAALTARGLPSRVAALVTRTLVDPADPAFGRPTKPIGRYRTATEAARAQALGQDWQDFGERGWRRVVASPEPLAVLDAEVGRALLESGTTVVLAGGGGVPVVRRDGRLTGVDAVIDKDLAAALLADNLDCDLLVIATDVEQAVLGFGTPNPRPLGLIEPADLQDHLDRGEFGAGSMGPKVTAAIRFAQGRAGRRAVITSLDRLADAVTGPPGSVGTVVTTASPV